jgi:hypothetical protein
MVTQLGFPYLDGTTFTSELFARGGFGAVDEAWADPPGSTEQVLHFEAYVDDEAVLEVSGIELRPGTDVLSSREFGEAMLGIWLGALGVDQTDADQAATGWGGDDIHAVVSTETNDVAVVLVVAWDSPLDATEFTAAYEDALARTSLFGRIELIPGDETVVVQGTSQELVDLLAGL